jgi:hypothetical protein
MRTLGAVILVAGLLLCIADDDVEPRSVIPMVVGLIILAIGEQKAKTLELAKVKIDQGLSAPKRNALLEEIPDQLSPEVQRRVRLV